MIFNDFLSIRNMNARELSRAQADAVRDALDSEVVRALESILGRYGFQNSDEMVADAVAKIARLGD